MQWSDVIAPPRPKTLRQFGALWLLFFGGLAVWRMWHGPVDTGAETLGALALVVGALGLVRPSAVRWIYTGWMIAAFPIGWTLSNLMLAALFYLVFTPVALFFRLVGRDALQLRRRQVTTYWSVKPGPTVSEEYFRQS